jgi:hypothetical protein
MLPLYLSEDDEYPDSCGLSCKTSSATKSALLCDDSGDVIYNIYGGICDIYGKFKICEKYEKRQREKKAKFAFKEHTNVYYKPEWVCAPGYDYPGPQHIPHKLVTAVRAKKIVCKQDHKAKRVAISKKKARRPSKYVFEPE